jgi:hypothetical protein
MSFLATIRRHAPWATLASFMLAGPVAAWDDATSATAPFKPPPVIFEGLGLGDFEGTGSVASALRQSGGSPRAEQPLLEFKGIEVRGPSGRDAAPAPMAAEVQSRIDWIDVSAGVTADPERLREGPSRWTGRIGLSHDRESGSESLELRTVLSPSDTASMVGVTVGPKIERKLRRGLTVFIDGRAEAQAFRPADAGWWSLPGVADGSLATLGLTARTGIVR